LILRPIRLELTIWNRGRVAIKSTRFLLVQIS
jgi:hypothetical protein